MLYLTSMILSFSCKETEKIWNGVYSRKFSKGLQQLARRKLRMVCAAKNIKDLQVPPGNCLEKLNGTRKEQFSIRINNQWRICFKWEGSDAKEVIILDYH